MKSHTLSLFRSTRRAAAGFAVLFAIGSQPVNAIEQGQVADLILGRKYGYKDGFDKPSGVAVDPATKKVFVADSMRHRVLRFGSAASLINGAEAEAVLGQPGFLTFGSGTAPDRMNKPGRLHCDAGGRLWVCDVLNRRVLRFDNAATLPSGAAASGWLGTGNSDPAPKNIAQPFGVVTDVLGNLYVADSQNHRVLRFNNAANLPNEAPASAALGQANLTSDITGSGASQCFYPRGLAIEGDNTPGKPIRLYVADITLDRIVRFDVPQSKVSGSPATVQYGQPDFGFDEIEPLDETRYGEPTAIAVDSSGTLYVSCPGDRRILRITAAATKSGDISADGVLGAPNFTTEPDSGPTSSQFDPADIATDGSQRLWVADVAHKRVLRFDGPGALPNGAPASGLLGETTLATAGDNRMHPSAVAVDPVSGKVFVADERNNRILRYGSAGALTSQSVAEAVLGQPGFWGVTGAITQDRMRAPRGVAVDSTGRLWVADSSNNRVLRFDNAANLPSGALASGVLGQDDFGGGGSPTPPTATSIKSPLGVATGPNGRLWVADFGNNRVLRFDNAAAKPNGAAADAILGQKLPQDAASSLSAAGLSGPWGLCEDAGGKLWVADCLNNRVLGYASAGSAQSGAAASWVLGQVSFLTDENDYLMQPVGVAVNAGGRLYVSARFDDAVMWYDNAGGFLNTRTFPNGWFATSGGFESAGTAGDRFNAPYGLALDNNGSLFVADRGNDRVLRFLAVAPRFTAVEKAGAALSLKFDSVPGQTYLIRRSTDLKTWEPLPAVTGMGWSTSWLAPGNVFAAARRFYTLQVQ